ncbi:MAG: hypothetical protein M1835_000637 [Candelina submexicana]|nr:MAG: hypothetical protein M1835_000637 [Candelina submexicana]
MDVAYNRHARPSHPNLKNHFSLAPLTSKFPIQDDDEILPPVSPISYLEGRSAPTTPRILSRNASSPRLISKQAQLFKSKSAANLPHSRSLKQVQEPPEWLFRAGATISSETRESKGQSWLISRASSTSLVDNEGREETSFADDEYSPLSTRNSRACSRIASARTSRRGSRVASKLELLTPINSRTSGGHGGEGASLFEEEDVVIEPDFVDIDKDIIDDTVDDVEIQQLTKERGFGLGRWMDTLIGWSLFTEDGEESDKEPPEEQPEKRENNSEARIGRVRDGRVALEPQAGGGTERSLDARSNEGGWQDAAWLLSVAVKVLL